MKKIFSGTEFKVFIIILFIITVGLLAFYGYNEYTYQKAGICISEGNYDLAGNYLDGISPSYKDIRKIKSLLSIIENIDNDNSDELNRAYAKLEALKGFRNENINYTYNSLVLSVYKKLCTAEIYSAAMQTSFSAEPSDALTTSQYTTANIPVSQEVLSEFPTEAVSAAAPIETTFYTDITEPYIASTEYFAVSTTVTTTEYTTLPTSGQATTYPATIKGPDENQAYTTGMVYYVESGEVYHITATCRTLARSTNILSGPVPEGRRACKVCSQ